jgi:hypothetical protein
VKPRDRRRRPRCSKWPWMPSMIVSLSLLSVHDHAPHHRSLRSRVRPHTLCDGLVGPRTPHIPTSFFYHHQSMALIPRSVAHKRRRTASHTTIKEDAVSPVASSITILQSDNKRPKLGISPTVDDQRDLDTLVDAVAWCFGDVGCELGNGSNRIRREISECRCESGNHQTRRYLAD